MKTLLLSLVILVGLYAHGLAQTWPSDCYAPATGHPTSAEKTSFVNAITPIARLAEKRYGTPAAGMTAIACNESGFGWTRIAYFANNYYGFKYTSSTQSGGRTYYVLANQPASDPNNKYIKFCDMRDCVMFVANRLATATSPNYKAVTDKYKADIANGVNVQTAVNTWVSGIQQAGYNPYTTWTTTTKKFLNNYMSPSTTYSSTYNLYKYSPNTGFWITINTPWSGSYVSGTPTLSATTGNGTVTQVKFFTKAASSSSWYNLFNDTASPWSCNWATVGYVADGLYNIRVEAYNGSTLLGTDMITVRVQNAVALHSLQRVLELAGCMTTMEASEALGG